MGRHSAPEEDEDPTVAYTYFSHPETIPFRMVEDPTVAYTYFSHPETIRFRMVVDEPTTGPIEIVDPTTQPIRAQRGET